MKNLVSIIAVLCLLSGCKKEVAGNSNVSAEKSITGVWESDYLGSKLTFEIKEGAQCEMTLPYIVKKDAVSPPVKGLIQLTGHYSRSTAGRIVSVDALQAISSSASASLSSQDAWNLLRNLNVVVHRTDTDLAESLSIAWHDERLNF